MRIVVVALTFAALVVGLPAVASAQPSCTTIQSGTLLKGMSRPLLKLGGGSVDILRDVLH